MAYSADSSDKQRVNLSAAAWEVVGYDMSVFGEESRASFIQRIFCNYCREAEASVALSVDRKESELDDILDNILSKCRASDAGAEEMKLAVKKVKKAMLAAEKKRLKTKNDSYENGESVIISLRKAIFSYLTDENSECREEKYYKRGQYIKNVVEEYARLPYIRRESIYFAEIVEEIRRAVKEKKLLNVKPDLGKSYEVHPYKILGDPLATANYLVGYSRPLGAEDAAKQPSSFRLARIKSLQTMSGKSGKLSKAEKDELDKKISLRGVQFMTWNETEVTVRLTAEGVKKCERQLHLRPTLIRSEDGGVFVFRCTQQQAEFYFFKFGKDAEIISPAGLREKFGALYGEAAALYRGDARQPD